LYGGGGVSDKDRGVIDGGVGCDCTCARKTNPVLDSVSDLYSEAEEISVGDSRLFSRLAYTLY